MVFHLDKTASLMHCRGEVFENKNMLYLMRHGEAQNTAPTDALRPLSERGRAQVQETCEWLLRQPAQPAGIVASPYLRAQQTAEILATRLNWPIQTSGALIPETSPTKAEQALRKFEDVVVCFHQPILGRLLHRWTQQQPSVPTGAIFALEGDFLAPDWMQLKDYFWPQ